MILNLTFFSLLFIVFTLVGDAAIIASLMFADRKLNKSKTIIKILLRIRQSSIEDDLIKKMFTFMIVQRNFEE